MSPSIHGKSNIPDFSQRNVENQGGQAPTKEARKSDIEKDSVAEGSKEAKPLTEGAGAQALELKGNIEKLKKADNGIKESSVFIASFHNTGALPNDPKFIKGAEMETKRNLKNAFQAFKPEIDSKEVQ